MMDVKSNNKLHLRAFIQTNDRRLIAGDEDQRDDNRHCKNYDDEIVTNNKLCPRLRFS